MNASAKRDGAVNHAPGNHDIGPGAQRFGDGEGAQVGVDAGDLVHGWERRPGEHLGNIAGRQLCGPGQKIIAGHHGHAQIQPSRIDQLAYRRGAGSGIHAAGVGDHLDALPGNFGQVRPERGGDKVHRVAERRVRGPGPRHDRHRDFGQVVVNEVIELPVTQQLRSGQRGLAPEAAGATDSNDPVVRCFRHRYHKWVDLDI